MKKDMQPAGTLFGIPVFIGSKTEMSILILNEIKKHFSKKNYLHVKEFTDLFTKIEKNYARTYTKTKTATKKRKA